MLSQTLDRGLFFIVYIVNAAECRSLNKTVYQSPSFQDS